MVAGGRAGAVAFAGAVAALSLALVRCSGTAGLDDDAGLDGADAAVADVNVREEDGAADAACDHPPVVEDCHDGWCRIPKGCFWMGSPETEFGKLGDSENLRAITLTHDFIIQQHELTQSEWSASGRPNRAHWVDKGDAGASYGDCTSPECPASELTWWEAAEFANELSVREGLPPCYQLTGCSGDTTPSSWRVCDAAAPTATSPYACGGFRMPTDAEWEYAARAGTRTAFYSGEITAYSSEFDCNPDERLDPIGWYCWNSGMSTHPVGLKAPNAWGLFDMAGNGGEYTNEPFAYARTGTDPWSPIPPPQLPQYTNVTFRSGVAQLWASGCRSASRNFVSKQAHAPTLGVRFVRTLEGGGPWSAPFLGGSPTDAAGQ